MSYKSRLESKNMDLLFEAILSLKDVEECYRFFEDICTINELNALSQRWEVAGMLEEGLTYNEIERQTKASTATISRVNKSLNYGADGYKIVLARKKYNT